MPVSKLVDLKQNQAVPNGAGLTFDPLLFDEIPNSNPQLPPTLTNVAPDIIIPVPKAIGASAAVTTPMATGNQTVVQNNAGAILFDILTIRLISFLRAISIAQPPGATPPPTTSQISASLVRFFVIADAGNNAPQGAVYADNANPSNTYTVLDAKVAGDGATVLIAYRNQGGLTDNVSATGTLNLVSGTGSATINWLAPGILFEKYADIENSVSVPNGAGLTIHPGLGENAAFVSAVPGPFVSPLITPDIVVPVPKVVPALATNESFVPTILAGEPTGITIQTAEGAPVNHDILSFSPLIIQRVLTEFFGQTNDRRRYFVIANGVNAGHGAVYADNADSTKQYTVQIAKVAGDGSTLLTCIRNLGGNTPDNASATGTLNLVSGTGDATIGWLAPGIKFEKYMDVRQNVAVPNGAGLTFDPQLVVNGTPVMPDIVIPVPKATGTVPFVATDLTGPVGSVNVSHNNAAPINHDILSIKVLFKQ